MKYFKLIRDRVPDRIRRNGGTPVYHFVDRLLFEYRLKEKLREEVGELLRSTDADARTEEMADVIEVLLEMISFYKLSRRRVEQVRRRKARTHGRFKKRIVLEEA